MTFRELHGAEKAAFRAVLFDIDGTLVSGSRAMPGAAALLDALRDEGVPFLLLTNDSHHSPAEKTGYLARAGVPAFPDEIVSCSHALPDFVAERGLRGSRVFIMGEFGNPDYAEAAGLTPCRDLAAIDDCAFVIAGEGPFDWHDVFTGVINYFRRHPDRALVVPNPDTYWPNAGTGQYGIGAGAQARFICTVLAEMHITVEPVYFGKPYPRIYRHALTYLQERFPLPGLRAGEVAMVGDSLRSDIAGARALGMKSVLVMTGITTPEILRAAPAEMRPDWVCDAVGRGVSD
ncbi:Ribonucleotide monophosphatase NagD [bioreactor metagenome]|uniref:Ribonucleotide monophosphatase NagD n=1 Tax=bioreactor metagenome TaxID=1076179 RepID=A0A645BS97_9ZZZZ